MEFEQLCLGQSIRLAIIDDIDEIAGLWDRASAWLASINSDQWQYPANRSKIRASVESGNCWVALGERGLIIGTITLDAEADPEFWGPEDDPDSALYAHRVITERELGKHLGATLLDWARRRAHQAGRNYLRLDAWKSNTKLHDYYRSQGFTLIRIVDASHRGSGALFQATSISSD